jgi:hypothetical protein
MTVLQIHEEMAFAVMSFCPCLIGTKSLLESLDLTPKAVSKYFNKVRTGHTFVGPELVNAGITITPEPFPDNCFLAKKAGSVKRVTEDCLPQNEYRTQKQKEHAVHFFCDL